MNLSSSGLFGSADNEVLGKKLRYAGVSMVFVPIGQGLIQLVGLWLDDYATATLVVMVIIMVPSFFVNKHFVWRVTSSENLRRQVLVFCVVMTLSFALAAFFSYIVDAATAGETTPIRGTAVFLAQLLGFGIVWIGRYVFLDRWLFKTPVDAPEDTDAVIDGISSA
jgi:putative flippase GtrA